MKDSKKTAMLIILWLFGACFSAFSSDLSQIVETSLRKPLNLIIGPATQVVDYQLENKTFVIVIADLSFNKTVSNPFGRKNDSENRRSEKRIEKAVRTTMLKIQKTKYAKRKTIYLIIFDKKLFGRTDNRTIRKFIFRGTFSKGKLVKLEKLK